MMRGEGEKSPSLNLNKRRLTMNKVKNSDKNIVDSILNHLSEELDPGSPLEENIHVRLGDKKSIRKAKNYRKFNKKRRKRFGGNKNKFLKEF